MVTGKVWRWPMGAAVWACMVLLAATALDAQTITTLTLKTNDLVYVPQTGRIYASVPSTGGVYGNDVVAIDPATGSITGALYIGSEPGRLAASDDGAVLYVGLDGAGAVRVVDLQTFTAGTQFSLVSFNNFCSAPYARDMAVQPGSHTVVAVVQGCLDSSGSQGIAIYDNGVRRTTVASATYDYGTITFGASPLALYAYDNHTTACTFSRLRVDADGVTRIDSVDDILSSSGGDIRFAAGRIYYSGGEVVDPEVPAPAGIFPGGGYATTVDPPRGLAFVLRDHPTISGSRMITAFEITTFLAQWFVELPSAPSLSSRAALVQAGTNRFAFRSTGAVVVVDATAIAATQYYRLRVDKNGTGTGTVRSSVGDIACGTTCSAEYAAGTTVTLTATADTGSVFTEWSGTEDCADGVVTIESARTCTATFTRSAGGPVVRRIALKAGHLLFDPAAQLLYASLSGTNGAIGNSVTTIDPATGGVGAPLWVGSEPSRLAMSDDRQFLYVGLDGAASVARVDIASNAVDMQFPLGPDYYYKKLRALRVQPGNSHVVVVGRGRSYGSDGHTVAYEDGVARPSVLAWYQAEPEFDFGGTPATLYSRTYSIRYLLTVGLDAGGLHIQNTASYSVSGLMEFENGRLYLGTGRVVDPVAGVQVGVMQVGSASGLAIDTPRNQAIALKSKDSYTVTLTAFDLGTLVPLWTVDVPLNGYPASGVSSLVRWGASGFAFLVADAIFVVDVGTSTTDPRYRLRVDKYGTGSGTVTATAVGISCGTGCTADLAPGTVVALTAAAASGSVFAGWAGGDDCSDGVVTMTAPTACTAIFNSTGAVVALTRRIPLRANDLAYDATTGRIFASLASSNGSIGNSLVSVDPATGQVDTPVWVGSEPTRISLSADGGTMYVGTDGSSSIARMRLPSGTVDLRFVVSSAPSQIRVRPGDSNVVLASYGTSAAMTAYDNGAARSSAVASVTAFDFGANGDTLYANRSGDLAVLSLSGAGVQTAATFASLLGSSGPTLDYDAGRIFLPTGVVIDPQDGRRLGTFPGATSSSLVVPESTSGTAFLLNTKNSESRALASCDVSTFLPRWTVDVPLNGSSSSSVRSLVHWGTASFGFLTDDAIFIVDAETAVPNPRHRLRVDKYGTGSGMVTAVAAGISCGTACSADVAPDTVVTLTAAAASGSTFAGWSGGDDCADGVVTMTAPQACIATFNSTGAPAALTRRIPLLANDLVYDPATGRLLASLGSSNGSIGNSLVTIDPATGQLDTPVWVGSEPTRLALSADGGTMYVGTNGALAIVRMRLPARTVDLRFQVPTAPSQLRVQPGNSNVVVGSVGSSAFLTAYDGGTARAGTVGYIGTFDFGADGTVLYGADYSDLVVMSLSAAGVQRGTSFYSALGSSSGFEYDGGRIFVSTGAVVNPQNGARFGTFSGPTYSSLVAPETDSSTAFYLNSKSGDSTVRTLAAYDTTTFLPLWSADIPLGSSPNIVRSLARWGATGVAFLTSDAVIIADYAGLQTSALLTITKAGVGSGTVVSPSGIDCGSACKAQFQLGATIALRAIPSGAWVFAGWSGDADCTDGVVTIAGPANCIATFSANPLSFTDNPLVARVTQIKAAHIAELRQRIDDLRNRHSLPAMAWTDATIVPGVTAAKVVHLVELRTAIGQVYAAAGRAAPYFANPTVTAEQTVITVAQIQELRAAVGGIW